ncbi:exo-alpha-sialidase [Streptomyces sp. URMC 123]|uniref:exo-alpha-sialidase n=1 Tax=Streptomyces sp. URMC 123 TaxID=3423403 RepID=UPI003F1DF022
MLTAAALPFLPASLATGPAAASPASTATSAPSAASAPAAAPAAPPPAAVPAPPPEFDQQVLFDPAREAGYTCFRIPAVVRAVDGTLLAFAEGRVDNCGDAGDIDLVLKRSADGGRTWGPLQVVDRGLGDTHGNPAPVVDARTGRIVLATTYNEGRADSRPCEVPCDRTPHVQYSDDSGATWSRPRDLTGSIRRPEWGTWYATGPVHGIQLTRGPHAGRLVFGINAESWDGDRITANHAALVHSDDGGATWRLGALDTWPIAADGGFRQKPSELTVAERRDGSVYVNGREQDGTDLGHRTHAVSRDGGRTFAERFRALPDLYTPQVQGAVLALPEAGRAGGSRMLFSAPGDPDRRRTMMVRSSYDEGRTWESLDRGKVVTTDWSGYSDMVNVSPGRIGLLYEAGRTDSREEIRFARFTESWLGGRRGPDPTTPDRAPGGGNAAVLGGAWQVGSPFGRALAFDGDDDGVRLPYHDGLRLGTRDFTAVLWFRYDADRGEQPFLSLGGTGLKQPQVTLTGEPGEGRITGRITAVDGRSPAATAVVHSDEAYNDGDWHRLVLRRSGGVLTLMVDDEAFSAPDVPGSVSSNSPFGVHLGEGMDNRAHFAGVLDEVRVYSRALSDAELEEDPRDALAADSEEADSDAARPGPTGADAPRSGAAADRDTVLWLPLDEVRRRG